MAAHGAIRHESLWRDDEDELDAPVDVESLADDVVIGAGLTGLTTALLLARAGREVTLLEARSIGAVTTGNTTAKISLLQGTRLSSILDHHSAKVAGSYLEGNREGQSWLRRYCEDHGIDVQPRDAFSYASTDSGVSAVEKEHQAARQLGLDTELVEDADVPFPFAGAVMLRDQAQFDPMQALRELARDFAGHGGHLHEGVRALEVSAGSPCRIRTTGGTIRADNVILATGTPFLDRGLYFAKLRPERSYALAFRVPGLEPTPMYLSVDAPRRSLRTAPTAEGEVLLVGGNGHPVGRAARHQERVDDLISWTTRHFPGAEATHSWSAQDYATPDHVPFVGSFPRGRGHVYLATGYGKWGMTNAVAAALRISSEILGGRLPWARPMSRRVTGPKTALRGLAFNLEVGIELAKGWSRTVLTELDETEPSEGDGVVGRSGVKAVAVSNVEGNVCALTAVCTHLGGIVRWNDAERSWDCPLHGSRFAADGSVLEGPATTPLEWPD